MDNKKLLLGAALSAMFAASACTSSSDKGATSAVKSAKGECHGINSCKGKGDCGGKGYSCAGKNSCKGKGWMKMSKKKCKAKGGQFKKG